MQPHEEHYDTYWQGPATPAAAMAAPQKPAATVEINLPAKKPRAEVDPGTLPTLMQLLTQRLAAGEKFDLTVQRIESWDQSWQNKMYLGTMPLVNDADGEGTLRWIGKGLDAEGKPLKTKNGGSYIRLSPDTRQVGNPEAVKLIDANGNPQWRAIGFFLLFERQGNYVGEFHTGVPAFPLIRVQGHLTSVPDPRNPLEQKRVIRLSLAAVPASIAPPGVQAPPAPAPAVVTTLRVVNKDAPPPESRYDW